MTTFIKFYESHFEDYVSAVKKENLHPKIEKKIFKSFPEKIRQFKNLIFYGPSGVGKYSQALYCIHKYSPSELKYEKKLSITFNKQVYFLKISDVHFEIDMSLLGCNSKLLWHDIYMQIVDILSAKTEKSGIILCKNFQEIHGELLENFYSYMQQNNTTIVDIKFILITEQISFLPDNILNCCEVISIPRPSKTNYNKVLNSIDNCTSNSIGNSLDKSKTKLSNHFLLENITNMKQLYSLTPQPNEQYKIVCDRILENMKKYEDINFSTFRDLLYDIFIYNLNMNDCIWYILTEWIKEMKKMNRLTSSKMSKVLIKTYLFFQYFNNNYRPIYHVENYILYLVSIMHFDKKET